MPERRHRQKRQRQPDIIDLLNEWRAASHRYHIGQGTKQEYEAAKGAWEDAKQARMEAEARRRRQDG
jgi:hypothetical protein